MKRILTRRFSTMEVAGFLAFVMVAVAVYVQATTTVPYTFQPNTKAKSSEVNANFTALATAIDSIPAGPQGPQGPVGADGADGMDGADGSPDSADQVRDKFFSGTSCAGNSANDKMIKVGPLCVDQYEASVWSNADGTGTQYGTTGDDYPAGFPDTGNWTTAVYAVSMASVLPSADITWFQAQQACALSGKRLLTNAEWQMAAAGTPTTYEPGADDGSTECNTSTAGAAVNTGSRSTCVSNWGVNDMVGNVSEWVADWMQGPNGNGTGNLWSPGTVSTSSSTYGNDFIIGVNEASPATDRFPGAIFRGGAMFDGAGAGVFEMYAALAPSYSVNEVGFRCAR